MIEIFRIKPLTTFDVDVLRDEKYRGVYETAKSYISYINWVRFREPTILMTKDTIQLAPIVIIIQKPSCLKKPFDQQILAFQSSGLIQDFEKYFTKNIKDIEDKEPKKLNIDQFIGLIEICAVLYALSFLIFLMELLALKHEKMKKFIDFFTFK